MSKRLIDANELMDALNVFKDRKNGNEHFMYGIETAKELLEIQTTVDAVPVVRCRECKYRIDVDGLSKSGYFCERCHFSFDMENCDDFYCADGERRTDEQQSKG